jgi:hypothetical protein
VNAKPPGQDRAAADSNEDSAADSVTATRHPPVFGFDVLDTLEYGFGAWGYDVIDVINEGRERELPTLCLGCGEAWLMGPEALASGKCWTCRTA